MPTTCPRGHFDAQYSRNAFFSPRDVRFTLYDPGLWETVKPLLREGRRVADLGAGGGTLLYNISRVTDAELVAVDFSPAAEIQLRRMLPKARILTEDVTRTSIESRSCDVVVSTMTIEHVDEEAFLAEAFRILADRGHLLVTSVLKRKGARYFYRNARGESVLEPTHLREYTSVDELPERLRRAGFDVVAVATPAIRFPAIDPLIKILFRGSNGRWEGALTSAPVEFLRYITRLPIPGYRAIEVLARKTGRVVVPERSGI